MCVCACACVSARACVYNNFRTAHADAYVSVFVVEENPKACNESTLDKRTLVENQTTIVRLCSKHILIILFLIWNYFITLGILCMSIVTTNIYTEFNHAVNIRKQLYGFLFFSQDKRITGTDWKMKLFPSPLQSWRSEYGKETRKLQFRMKRHSAQI